jgi:DNA-directed RNA polymerase specialized sigma24 family protein
MLELARLRREDMRLRQEQGLSYAAVAADFGLSKGRIGQVTQTAPPAQRALFGVGPTPTLRYSGREADHCR